jgi:predicted DNA-binding transcriptional regulator YafY
MRADRLLNILLLLQTHRTMTARELARRLEVTVRTVHRDMEALSMAGVPVYARRGTGGGWTLPDDWRTDVAGLSGVEAAALLIGGAARQLAELGLAPASVAARNKLEAALPDAARLSAQFARERLHIDGVGWYGRTEPVPFLRPLQEALWAGKRVKVAYEKLSGLVERTVDPLGLVAKGGIWYAAVSTPDDAEVRTYRVSRIRLLEALQEPAVRPDHFDLSAWWEASKASFKERLPVYPAVLLADSAGLDRLRGAAFVELMDEGDAVPSGAPEAAADAMSTGAQDGESDAGTTAAQHAASNEATMAAQLDACNEATMAAQHAAPDGMPITAPNATSTRAVWVRVAVRFQTLESACSLLLSLGTHVKAVEPPELCAEMVRLVRELAEQYAAP